jgi:glucose/arabinose dehydrogenase
LASGVHVRLRRRWAAVVAVAVLLASCGGGAAGAGSTASDVVSIGAGLKGPSGLVASTYATGLPHAAAFAFDAEGRLWVATAAYDDTGEDAVYMVASAGATPVKVIAGVHTPLGLMWHDGELYVSSHERVDAYSNFDGKSFAGSRAVVTFPAGVGENNGLAWSPEGRIVLGISAPCDACTPSSQYSAAIVSFLPDGSDLRVDASGIRAPIGLAYYPGTSDLFVTMNQRDDLGAATPGDWLAVVRSGDQWGFPSCYGQSEAACAGVPSARAVLDKHAAVSGVAIVTGQLGSVVGNAAVVAEWATGKVVRVSLARHGSSYTAKVEPFLTGVKNPVAVALGPDGALYVGDWSSGVIYRVTT